MTRRRPTRSATTPPARAKSANGIPPAARTRPRSVAEPEAEDGEGDRDRRDPIADDRQRLAREEQAEGGVLPQRRGQPLLDRSRRIGGGA